LLHDPIAVRMQRDIEVQDSPPPVLDDKKAIECAKRQTRNREEVERGDYLAVVVEEGQPASRLPRIAVSLQPPQISRHGGFGNLESQLEQFAMDAGRPPGRILRLHAPDQLPDLWTHLRSAPSTKPGPPPPKQTEARTMPGNHGLRLDKDQGLGPAGPQSAEHNPEQPIKAIQLRARLLALKHGKLLAKGSGFQSEIVTRQKEGAEVGDHRTGKSEHLSDIS